MLVDRLGVSERRACLIAGQHRSTQRRETCVAEDDAALRAALRALSRERPRWGYRRAHARLLEDGWVLNRKRTQRVWREEGLRVPQRRRKRQRLGESTVPASRLRAERPNQVWALDFQFDQTADGRIVKLLHVVDEFTREALEMKCERRIDADSTVVTLARLVALVLPGDIQASVEEDTSLRRSCGDGEVITDDNMLPEWRQLMHWERP